MVGANGSALHMILLYNGKSFYFILFAIALVYLFFAEKDKGIKRVLLILSCVVGVVFLFPFTLKLAICLLDEEETYYRVLWMLPVKLTVAYAATRVVFMWKDVKWRLAAGVAAVLLICLTGNYVFNNPLYTKAENAYKVPQDVIDLCDEMRVEGREVRAAVPVELLGYFRQYSADIQLAYGYNIVVARWNIIHGMYDALEANPVIASDVVREARKFGCQYFVLPKDRVIEGDLTELQFVEYGTSENYIIYRDLTAYLGTDPNYQSWWEPGMADECDNSEK